MKAYLENGDVWDTDCAISNAEDYSYYNKQSEEIIKSFKKGELTV